MNKEIIYLAGAISISLLAQDQTLTPQVHQAFNENEVSMLSRKEINDIEKLVHDGVQLIEKKDPYAACIEFKNNPAWFYPNTQLFLYDDHGIIWLCTHDNLLSWNKTFMQTLEIADRTLLTKVIQENNNQNGWVPFFTWEGDIIVGYFKNTINNGKKYTFGALAFPQNLTHTTVKMVLETSNYLHKYGLNEMLNTINRLVGPFIQGSISVSVYDESGIDIADSYDVTRINLGSDFWTDDQKQNVFKTFEQATDNPRKFGWAITTFQGHKKSTFVLKTTVPQTDKVVYITSGFYEELTDDYIINLVRKAKRKFIKNGVKIFDAPFTISSDIQTLRLSIVIYDDKGNVCLHSRYPSLRGVNLINHQDHAGNYVTKNLIDVANKKGSGWVFSYLFNAVQPIYLEKAVLPEGTFIVTIQGYTPIDKKNNIANRAEIIARYILDHSFKQAIMALNGNNQDYVNFELWNNAGYFFRVYDEEGYCISAGKNYQKIWDKADKEIFEFIKTLESKNKEGDWFSYKRKSKAYSVYVKKCNKSPTEKYTIVVGYISIPTKG